MLLWLVFIPCCLGLLVVRGMKREWQKLPMVWMTGFFAMIAGFQVLYLGFVMYYNHFGTLVVTFQVVATATALASLLLWIVTKRKQQMNKGNTQPEKVTVGEVFLWLAFLVVLGIQIYYALFYQYLDGDDAFYVATSVTVEATNSMYLKIPYTGESSILDKRHAFSAAPVFVAFLGRVCNLHPTIIAHTVLPVVVLLLFYSVYMYIGKLLFENRRAAVPLFLLVLSGLILFGTDTIYSSATFLMTRTAQGKAFLAAIIPAAIFLGLLMVWNTLGDDEWKENGKRRMSSTQRASWLFLGIIMMAAVYTSMMGIFLAPVLVGGTTVLLVCGYRKIQLLVPCMLAMLPLLLVGLLFLSLLR